MSTNRFESGVIVSYGNEKFQLKREVEPKLWQLENLRTGRFSETSLEKLRKMYLDRVLFFHSDQLGEAVRPDKDYNAILDERALSLARRRLKLVKVVLALPSSEKYIKLEIEKLKASGEVWQRLPSARTVLRWKRAYIDSGNDLCSLVPKNSSKGNRKARYDKEIEQIADSVIEEVYLKLERHTIEDVIVAIKAKVKLHNHLAVASEQLVAPTRRYVESKIRSIPEFDKVAARHGYTAAQHRFRSVRAVPQVDAPLTRAEIDHTKLDLFVIDDDVGSILGRPWLTICIDSFSRSILGMHIGFDDPSFLTVSYCLKHAFLPKDLPVFEGSTIDNTWHQFGVIDELVVDNGMEFHSSSLENACFSLGIEIHYAPRKVPWFKGKVERFFKEVNNSVAHKAPGTAFSNIFDKGDYDPTKQAVVRYSVLKFIIHKWIIDVYHVKSHSALQMSPSQKWKENIEEADISLPSDLDFIDATLSKSDSRTLTHKGIEYDRIFYNCSELANLRRCHGENLKVDIRVDDSNVGEIIVICPKTGKLIKVAALCSEYADGTSRWQHKIFQNYCVAKERENASDSWLVAKHEISELVKNELVISKQKTRARSAKFKEHSIGSGMSMDPHKGESQRVVQEREPDTEVYIDDECHEDELKFNIIKRSIENAGVSDE